MQSIITQDLNAAITKFTEQDIFNNVKAIVEFLRANTQTTYRYDPYDGSLIDKPLPPIVQDKKNEILTYSIKNEAPLEDGDLDDMSEGDIEQDEKERKWNDQTAENSAWEAICKTSNEDSKKTYKQLLKQILSSESDEVKKAITKNFNIAYKTLRLHASNPAPQQNDDREESKEPAKKIESQEEIGLEYSPDKNSM